MVKDLIVFALANSDPEITWSEAHEVWKDVIMATGRSDFPNQVNNVLGFPFIFRGALMIYSTEINEEMKIAASNALATITKEEVPKEVLVAYKLEKLSFGPDYIIPKPFDSRVFIDVSPAVAEAAIKNRVAKKPYSSIENYRRELEERLENSMSRFSKL